MHVRHGCTRRVILIGRWAIKLPYFSPIGPGRWFGFLCGLQANMREAVCSATGYPEFCPVLFALPGGFGLVMRRAEPLSDEVFLALDYEALVERPDYRVPAENKADSFGLLDGRIVAIDYGN